MASYCIEKFERQADGLEQVVCWRQDKHVHNASLITTIKQWLSLTQTGLWEVRANSYRSNQQTCPQNSLDYTS